MPPPSPLPLHRLFTLLRPHTFSAISPIRLSPDGKTLYSGGQDRHIMVWSVDDTAGTGRLLRSLEGVSQPCAPARSPDQRDLLLP